VESAFITEEWSYHCGLWVVLLAVTKGKSANFIKSIFCALTHDVVLLCTCCIT